MVSGMYSKREYLQRPDVKERRRKYNKEYQKKPLVKDSERKNTFRYEKCEPPLYDRDSFTTEFLQGIIDRRRNRDNP